MMDKKGSKIAKLEQEIGKIEDKFHELMCAADRDVIAKSSYTPRTKKIIEKFLTKQKIILSYINDFYREYEGKLTKIQESKLDSIKYRLSFEIEQSENFILKCDLVNNNIRVYKKENVPIFYDDNLKDKIKRLKHINNSVLLKMADGKWKVCSDIAVMYEHGIVLEKDLQSALKFHALAVKYKPDEKYADSEDEKTPDESQYSLSSVSPRAAKMKPPLRAGKDLRSEEDGVSRPRNKKGQTARKGREYEWNMVNAQYLTPSDTPISSVQKKAIEALKKASSASSTKISAALKKLSKAERDDAKKTVAALDSNKLLEKSKPAILEHAARRVDLFFYLLIAYHNTKTKVDFTNPMLQHGGGVKGCTEGAHSSLFTQLIDYSIFNKDEFEVANSRKKHHFRKISLLCGTHFLESTNATMEVPLSVNDFDQELEGQKISDESDIRKAAIDIVNKVAAGAMDPIQGLEEFLRAMEKTLNDIGNEKIVNSCNVPYLKRNNNTSRAHKEEILALTKKGTLSKTFFNNALNEAYVQSALRLSADEITSCRRNSRRRSEIYRLKMQELQFEIHNTRSTHLESSSSDFYKHILKFPIYNKYCFTEGDNGWYTDEDITNLLEHFYDGREDVQYFTPLEVYEDAGAALTQSLYDNCVKEITQAQIGASLPTTILIPINLGNCHWTALHLAFSTKDRSSPMISYVDPQGSRIPEEVVCALKAVYGVETDEIYVSKKRMQKDDYNCGPWVMATFDHLVRGGLPDEDLDIAQKRQEYEDILSDYVLSEIHPEIKDDIAAKKAQLKDKVSTFGHTKRTLVDSLNEEKELRAASSGSLSAVSQAPQSTHFKPVSIKPEDVQPRANNSNRRFQAQHSCDNAAALRR
jgi:hypothetical protein